mgnify:CR=1 FL=1
MWMEESRGTRINAERTRQALDTGATTVATACPFCLVMLRDGVKEAGPHGDGVRTQDVAEILAANAVKMAGLPIPVDQDGDAPDAAEEEAAPVPATTKKRGKAAAPAAE